MAPNDGGASQLRTKIKLPGTGVLTLARPRPTRAKTQKTRTGCRECKRRRIKCDEGRPACQRCVSSGRTCDISLDRAIIPGDHQGKAQVATNGVRPDSRILVEPNRILSLFKNQQQWDMFSIFLFTNDQAGTMPINTLSALTPQIAQQDVAVREMCCAIGAAANAFTYPGSDPKADKMVYNISLGHYNRALQAVRKAKPTASALLTVAVASILFVTYDIMRGDMATALAHFNHGHRIINSYFDERCKETGLAFSELQLSSIESALAEMQQRLATHPWALDLGFAGSTVGHRLQNNLQPRRHRHLVQDMPESFRDLSEALKWWDVTQQQSFQVHMQEPNRRSYPESVHSSPSHYSLASEENQTTTSENTAWEESFATLQSWHIRFAPLLQSARQRRDKSPYPFLSACTLETLYLETLTNLHAHQRWDSNVLPDVKPIYLDIIQTAREMQQSHDKPGAAGMLDNAIMRPLTFVLYKCRDADVREAVREILEEVNKNSQMAAPLLSMMNRKEGEEVPPKLRNIERSMGWYFTACGCSSGAMSIRQLEALQSR